MGLPKTVAEVQEAEEAEVPFLSLQRAIGSCAIGILQEDNTLLVFSRSMRDAKADASVLWELRPGDLVIALTDFEPPFGFIAEIVGDQQCCLYLPNLENLRALFIAHRGCAVRGASLPPLLRNVLNGHSSCIDSESKWEKLTRLKPANCMLLKTM